MTLSLFIPFAEVFCRNCLLVLLPAVILIGIASKFYFQTAQHLRTLGKGKWKLNLALRQAESTSHAKGDFMSCMNHEIRTPLNAVIGYLEIAKDEQADTAVLSFGMTGGLLNGEQKFDIKKRRLFHKKIPKAQPSGFLVAGAGFEPTTFGL